MYDFLLVINTNLPPILHRFPDIASDRSKITNLATPLGFNSPDGGVPLRHLHKMFCAYQGMAKVPNAIEILPKVSTACVGRMSVTDDRRQTDRRATAYSEREREFTFAKKHYRFRFQQISSICASGN